MAENDENPLPPLKMSTASMSRGLVSLEKPVKIFKDVTALTGQEQEPDGDTPLGDIRGLGPNTLRRLEDAGIVTAGELVRIDPDRSTIPGLNRVFVERLQDYVRRRLEEQAPSG